jgi:hypothetical protein
MHPGWLFPLLQPVFSAWTCLTACRTVPAGCISFTARSEVLMVLHLLPVAQVIILMGGMRSSGVRSELLKQEAQHEAWVERIDVMEHELAAVTQRMEVLSKELRSAAVLLSQQQPHPLPSAQLGS